MKNIFIIVTLWCGVFGDTSEVMEGDSVTLHINLTDIKQDDKILWRFGPEGPKSLIAHIDEKKIIYEESADESFRGRLEMNIVTGDLTIRNTRITHSGPYKAVIQRDAETSVLFNVIVNESPLEISAVTDEEKTLMKTEGESVTLNTDVQTQRGDLILWRFGPKPTLIAKHDKDNKSPIYYAGEFKDRLQVDDHTGSLIISNVKPTDTGVYQLKISSNNKQTLYKTFNVYVNVPSSGLSSGVIAGIVVPIILLGIAAFVAAVIYYRRRISKLQAMTVEVFNGDSLTLPPDCKDMLTANEGTWYFGDKEKIAEFKKKNKEIHTFDKGLDERFRKKLELDNKTGSLTITNIKTRHSGLYKLKISSRTGPSYSHYNVIVKARNKSVHLGGSVTLDTGVTDIKTNDEIVWTFGPDDTRIVRITGGINEPLTYYYPVKIFRDVLKLDPQIGHLTITNITSEQIGVYEVQTYKSGKTRYKKFMVTTHHSARNESEMVGIPLLNKADSAVRPAA